MPSLFRFDGDLDRRLVADWVSSPMAALWHSNSKNLGLADWPLSGNRYGGSFGSSALGGEWRLTGSVISLTACHS